jgi:hypothetical protein
LTVIIPSRDIKNLDPCIEAVAKQHAGEELGGLDFIIADDGIDWKQSRAARELLVVEGRDQIIRMPSPFNFPRNIGAATVRAVSDSDFIWLNDDALLETANGFRLMQRAWHLQGQDFGVLSSTTNVTGNPDQHRGGGNGIRDAGRRGIAFIAVFVPASTIHHIGLMDKRFGGIDEATGKTKYGFCDTDYCYRVRKAGLKIGIFDGCYVDHGSLTSSFRKSTYGQADMQPSLREFINKHGFNPFIEDR